MSASSSSIKLERVGPFIRVFYGSESYLVDFERNIKSVKKAVSDALKDRVNETEVLKVVNDFFEGMIRSGQLVEVEEERFAFTPSLVLEDGRIAEQGFDGKEAYFLVYNPKTGEVKKEEKLVVGDKTYFPLFNDDVKTEQVLFPSDVEEYGSDEALIQEITDFLDYWHEQRDRKERKLDVAYVFLTYIKDLLPQIPYRRALGRYGSGKSSWVEIVGSICYRPIFLAGCDSEPSLRRTFDLWRGTALIDEADFSHSDLFAVITKILNVGWSRDHGFYRCCDDKDPTKILSFYVYGPKLLATRENFRDTALESRCLTFTAFENVDLRPLYRMEKFKAQAQKLRNKLMLWRFRNYHNFKSKVHELENTELLKELYQDVEVKSRIKQVLTPLTLISQELKDGIITLAKEVSEALNTTDPEVEFEIEVKTALQRLNELTPLTPLTPLYEPHTDVSVYEVLLKDLASFMLKETEGLKEINQKDLKPLSTKLGLFFRRMGFKVVRGSNDGLRRVYIPTTWLRKEGDLTPLMGGYRGVSDVSDVSVKASVNQEKPKYEVHACHEPFKSVCSYCFERCMITHYVNGKQACSKCADKALRGEL